jgi:hypothetical protein
MFGITMLLMRLADYFRGRNDKRICTLCNYVAKDERELDNHIRQTHSN